jgi:hypothetical protein
VTVLLASLNPYYLMIYFTNLATRMEDSFE